MGAGGPAIGTRPAALTPRPSTAKLTHRAISTTSVTTCVGASGSIRSWPASPFEQWADRWWPTTTKLRPTTRRGYWGILQRHVRPYFEGWPLSDIGYMDVEEFITHLLGQGLSPKYTRDCVSVLSLVMKSAVRANLRKDNPAADHTIPIPTPQAPRG